MPDDREAMEDEFDTVARWTSEAVRELGPRYAIPAACRGSGSPDALRWMAAQLRLPAEAALLDCGAGVGGPAELAAVEFGVRPVLTDPMAGACRAAAALFGRPVVVAAGQALPFRDAAFDAAWSLGVLCTSEDQPGLLAQLRRVVRPGGPIALLVYIRIGKPSGEQPEGNDFPTLDKLHSMLQAAGLEGRAAADLERFEAPDADWQARADAVGALIERVHGGDERWKTADRQQRIMAGLLSRGEVAGRIEIVAS
ncbi:MAG: methyltransferase family protein [Pseudonocardiales bacterium]|nr:methyltransferase family protein [Pseudonocardiales bacterium]